MVRSSFEKPSALSLCGENSYFVKLRVRCIFFLDLTLNETQYLSVTVAF